MSKRIVGYCLSIVLVLCSAVAVAEKSHKVRQLGGACGEDANIVATCDVGLECKNGYCEMRSFLSAATVGCKEEMKKARVDAKYVAVHDGFCYINDNCRGMYDLAMAASPVTTRLLTKASSGSEAFAAEVAKLSDAEKASFKRAEDECKSCGKYCTVGAGFLGRGGY
jgi:hypothetical protein